MEELVLFRIFPSSASYVVRVIRFTNQWMQLYLNVIFVFYKTDYSMEILQKYTLKWWCDGESSRILIRIYSPNIPTYQFATSDLGVFIQSSSIVWSVYRKIAMANRSLCIFDNLRDISEEFRPFKRLYNKNEYRSYFNVPLSEICVKKLCQNSVQLKWEKIVYFSKSFNPLSFISITSSWKKKWEVHIWSTYISISNVHFGYNG